jgi:hypothetical protein
MDKSRFTFANWKKVLLVDYMNKGQEVDIREDKVLRQTSVVTYLM